MSVIVVQHVGTFVLEIARSMSTCDVHTEYSHGAMAFQIEY